MLVLPFLKVFRKPAIRGGEEHEGKMGPCLSPWTPRSLPALLHLVFLSVWHLAFQHLPWASQFESNSAHCFCFFLFSDHQLYCHRWPFWGNCSSWEENTRCFAIILLFYLIRVAQLHQLNTIINSRWMYGWWQIVSSSALSYRFIEFSFCNLKAVESSECCSTFSLLANK